MITDWPEQLPHAHHANKPHTTVPLSQTAHATNRTCHQPLNPRTALVIFQMAPYNVRNVLALKKKIKLKALLEEVHCDHLTILSANLIHQTFVLEFKGMRKVLSMFYYNLTYSGSI